MSETLTRRAILAGASSVTIIPLATAAAPRTASAAEDPALALWRAWQPLEDRRLELQARHDALRDSLPEEMQGAPGVHFATRYSGQFAPDQPPRGQKLYYCSEADIDRSTGPESLYGDDYEQRLAAWKLDMKRRLVEARQHHSAELERVGLGPVGRGMDAIEEQSAKLREALQVAPASSAAGVAAKLFVALQYAHYRNAAIEDLEAVSMIIAALRDVAGELPQDLAERVTRVVAADTGSKLSDALRHG